MDSQTGRATRFNGKDLNLNSAESNSTLGRVTGCKSRDRSLWFSSVPYSHDGEQQLKGILPDPHNLKILLHFSILFESIAKQTKNES
jgi:hypothetical protein